MIATIRKILVTQWGRYSSLPSGTSIFTTILFLMLNGQGAEYQTDSVMILKPDQLTAFLDAVSDQKYKTLFMLAVSVVRGRGNCWDSNGRMWIGKTIRFTFSEHINHQTFL
jgi:hypothetical protein